MKEKNNIHLSKSRNCFHIFSSIPLKSFSVNFSRLSCFQKVLVKYKGRTVPLLELRIAMPISLPKNSYISSAFVAPADGFGIIVLRFIALVSVS